MNILILDDDEITVDYVKKIVLEVFPKANCQTARNGDDSLAIVKNNSIDLMILDVELDEEKQMLGLDYALEISQENSKVDFIVISNFDKYAIMAYDIHPYFYFRKPLVVEKFKRILSDWEIEKLGCKNKKVEIIKIKTTSGIVLLNLNNIAYLERYNRKIKIVTTKNTYETSGSLKSFEKKLGSSFYKTYQSFIVNMELINSLTKQTDRSWEIRFEGIETKAILSRYKYKEFLIEYNKLYRNEL